MAERTTRRIKALELQNAIKAQVEERERIRKMELEKTRMEERRQEEKLRQQMESNEQRYEEEQRKTREKLEREQRKQELMRLAIEKARQEAEMEKSKKKRSTLTVECESVENSDDMQDDQDITTTRIKVPQSPINDKRSTIEIETDDHDTDDGEKILIGTPIKMRKKTLNKPQKVPLSAKKEVSVQSDKEPSTMPETNVDGIALVLQTLPPIMPILSNDIINLNQNINSLNTSNIQLAVMLAHQMQQLNTTIAQNQNQLPESTKTTAHETNTLDEKHPSSRSDCNDSNLKEVCKQCAGFNRINVQQSEPEKVR